MKTVAVGNFHKQRGRSGEVPFDTDPDWPRSVAENVNGLP